ncbi:MAG: acyl-CoA dehydrogenase family protein [Acidimicrobiales bacterium]
MPADSDHPAGSQEPAGLDALRADTSSRLARLLRPASEGAPVGVLGAGSDDLESGRAYLVTLAGGGFAVPGWPVAHGGMGLDQAGADTVRSVLAEFEAPDMYPFLVGLDLIGPTVLAHGNAEQQARWLSPMRSGEEIWCQMFSEPDAGSDLAGLKARAVRDGDGWRVTGSKVWTSRAHYSKWGLLLARHDPHVPKHKGITAFGIDMSAPGVNVRPLVQMNRDAHFNEVFLDDAWIPDTDRIGAAGEGWRVAITCLSFERGALGGELGVKADQLQSLAALLPAAGTAVGAVRRDEWAACLADFRVSQWSGMRAQESRRAGRAPGPEDSGSKLRGTALVKRIAALGMAAEGAGGTAGVGVVAGPGGAAAGAGDAPDEWQSMFLMSPSLSIRGGTDEIQRNILGERVLGLPAEPRVDKDRPFSET